MPFNSKIESDYIEHINKSLDEADKMIESVEDAQLFGIILKGLLDKKQLLDKKYLEKQLEELKVDPKKIPAINDYMENLVDLYDTDMYLSESLMTTMTSLTVRIEGKLVKTELPYFITENDSTLSIGEKFTLAKQTYIELLQTRIQSKIEYLASLSPVELEKNKKEKTDAKTMRANFENQTKDRVPPAVGTEAHVDPIGALQYVSNPPWLLRRLYQNHSIFEQSAHNLIMSAHRLPRYINTIAKAAVIAPFTLLLNMSSLLISFVEEAVLFKRGLFNIARIGGSRISNFMSGSNAVDQSEREPLIRNAAQNNAQPVVAPGQDTVENGDVSPITQASFLSPTSLSNALRGRRIPQGHSNSPDQEVPRIDLPRNMYQN